MEGTKGDDDDYDNDQHDHHDHHDYHDHYSFHDADAHCQLFPFDQRLKLDVVQLCETQKAIW